MKAQILILYIVIQSCFSVSAHPIHLSVVNIDYICDSDLIEYSVRLFYDDFQNILNRKYNTMINFAKENRMTSKEQESIQKYLNSNLKIMDSNGNIIAPVFLGWKVEEFSVWFFFRAKTRGVINSFSIENKLMLDVFMDQKNLLIINKTDIEKGLEFNQRITYQSIAI
jgi:hypothetical protein